MIKPLDQTVGSPPRLAQAVRSNLGEALPSLSITRVGRFLRHVILYPDIEKARR